jgi:hypothetical protein
LAELLELDIEIEVTGFETGEIDVLLHAGDLDGADPADATPAPAAVAVSRPGDLWEIGPHRLLCGDALDPTSYELVLDGAVPSAGFTDPPYNVPISGHVCGQGRVQHREFAMASGGMTKRQISRRPRNPARSTGTLARRYHRRPRAIIPGHHAMSISSGVAAEG